MVGVVCVQTNTSCANASNPTNTDRDKTVRSQAVRPEFLGSLMKLVRSLSGSELFRFLEVCSTQANSVYGTCATDRFASVLTGTTSTFATPLRTMSSLRAAASERSITRPRTNGPRSLIRTKTDVLLLRFVTRTLVPKGS